MSPVWFKETAEENFKTYLAEFKDKPGLSFLQIGALTGDASVWLAENILHPESYLHDVDTWAGSPGEIYTIDGPTNWDLVESEYDKAVAKYPNIIKHRSDSAEFLLSYNKVQFDFIYIDGDHTAAGVLKDSVLAFLHLKPGGIIAWDDLNWAADPDAKRRPGASINFFTWAFEDKLDLIVANNQAWFRKKT